MRFFAGDALGPVYLFDVIDVELLNFTCFVVGVPSVAESLNDLTVTVQLFAVRGAAITSALGISNDSNSKELKDIFCFLELFLQSSEKGWNRFDSEDIFAAMRLSANTEMTSV